MAVATVRTPAEFESRLAKYMYERSEESRAVRVGEKETSEQAEIVRRYADLFSRGQLEALREAEEGAGGDERERLFRLRKRAPLQTRPAAVPARARAPTGP